VDQFHELSLDSKLAILEHFVERISSMKTFPAMIDSMAERRPKLLLKRTELAGEVIFFEISERLIINYN
jgi:hypothetical protein